MRDLLGYLNFSQGSVSNRFRTVLNELFRDPDRARSPEVLQDYLLTELHRLSSSGDAACANPAQAESVIRLTLGKLIPAYQAHHYQQYQE